MFNELPLDLDTVLDLLLDGTQLYVACRNNRLFVYDVGMPTALPVEIVLQSIPVSLATSPQGCLVGCSDGSVRIVDSENFKADEVLCVGEGVVNFVRYMKNEQRVLATTIAGDIITSNIRTGETHKLRTSSKIFCADATDEVVVLGLAGARIQIYNSYDLSQPRETKELGTIHQVRSIRCLPNSLGYSLATLDGRVLLEYFQDPLANFTFKCHRVIDRATKTDEVFLINALVFADDSETLYTGGGDGTVCVWNCQKRKRTRIYPQFSTKNNRAVSVAKIFIAGDVLAVAVSDDLYIRATNTQPWAPQYPGKVYTRNLRDL